MTRCVFLLWLLAMPTASFAANPFLAPAKEVAADCQPAPSLTPSPPDVVTTEPPKAPDVDVIPSGATFLGKMNGQEVYYTSADGRYHYRKVTVESAVSAEKNQTGVEKTK